ncbi:MAG: T9SS type A sorting domain-containing protein, partial [Flavobacteriales bacterium]
NIRAGAISQVYPNPASAITCIPVIMAESRAVLVVLRDALGRTVEIIHDGLLPSGETKLFFNAAMIPSGAYIVNLEINNINVAVKKVMVP